MKSKDKRELEIIATLKATHIGPILTRFGCQILTQARIAP